MESALIEPPELLRPRGRDYPIDFLLWALRETHAQVEATGSIEDTFEGGLNGFDYRRTVRSDDKVPTKHRVRQWLAALEAAGLAQAPPGGRARALMSWDPPLLHHHAVCPFVLTRDGFLYATDLHQVLSEAVARDISLEMREMASGYLALMERVSKHPIIVGVSVAFVCGLLGVCVAGWLR